MKKKIFVTGATGLIGSHLVKKLVENGESVRILARKGSDNLFLNDLSIERVDGDLQDTAVLKQAVKDCHTIYHLAARISFNQNDYEETYRTNVLGTRNILAAALDAGVKKVVHASSASTLGMPSPHTTLFTEDTPFPDALKTPGYPYSKWLAEQEVFTACKKGLNVSLANISTVYGPGMKSVNADAIIKPIYRFPVFIAPPGGCSVIAVEDVVTGLSAIANKGRKRERYILTGQNMTYLELFDTVSRVVKNKRIIFSLPKITRYPALIAAILAEYTTTLTGISSKIITRNVIENTFLNRYLDNSKAWKELKWKPKTSFKTAVERTFTFYKQNDLL